MLPATASYKVVRLNGFLTADAAWRFRERLRDDFAYDWTVLAIVWDSGIPSRQGRMYW